MYEIALYDPILQILNAIRSAIIIIAGIFIVTGVIWSYVLATNSRSPGRKTLKGELFLPIALIIIGLVIAALYAAWKLDDRNRVRIAERWPYTITYKWR